MQSDDFFDDLERLRMTLSEKEVPHSIAAKKKERRRRQFVMVPLNWLEDLRVTRRASTLRVAHCLLYRYWKDKGQPIVLSNVVLSWWGVTRREKWRALAELERLGLVKVVRRLRRAPLVTVIMRPGGASCLHRGVS
jgi:hypothetical protein